LKIGENIYTVYYDMDGTRYGKGKGLNIIIEGK